MITRTDIKLMPRRSRRGITALMSVLFLSVIISFTLSSWQLEESRRRMNGELRHLTQVIEAEGYGLHHWLDEKAMDVNTICPGEALPCARALTAAELTELAAHDTIASWSRIRDPDNADVNNRNAILMAKDWHIVHLLVNTGQGLTDGIVVLRADDKLVSELSSEALEKIMKRFDAFVDSDTGVAAKAAAKVLKLYDNDPNDEFDPEKDIFNSSRDRAVLSSRFARIDYDAVLQRPQAGHPILPIRWPFNMNENDILNVDGINAISLLLGQYQPRTDGKITGTYDHDNDVTTDAILVMDNFTFKYNPDLGIRKFTVEGVMNAGDVDLVENNFMAPNKNIEKLSPSNKVDITDKVIVSGDMHTETADIKKTTKVSGFSVCEKDTVNPDLCSGGDLDMLSIAPGQSLSDVHVFGTTEAKDSVGNLISLEVNDCFRSANPLVTGGRC